jgi:hypothetical protein
VHKASLCRRLEALKGAATCEEKKKNKRESCIHNALSIILAEVDPAEVAEIRRVGLLGWVNALAMKNEASQRKP